MRTPNSKIDDPVYQFRIILQDTQPMVWRRIVVPGTYSFWDLHVAIQDAMGWKDYHLHMFRLQNPTSGQFDQIGIPMEDEFDDMPPQLAGWEILIASYFQEAGVQAEYEYDFGDGWQHEIALEKVSARMPKVKYPICIDGARACPPEDCGGTHGYEALLGVLADPTDEEYADMRRWAGADFNPDAFAAKQVRFDDPKKRWRNAFKDNPSLGQHH